MKNWKLPGAPTEGLLFFFDILYTCSLYLCLQKCAEIKFHLIVGYMSAIEYTQGHDVYLERRKFCVSRAKSCAAFIIKIQYRGKMYVCMVYHGQFSIIYP